MDSGKCTLFEFRFKVFTELHSGYNIELHASFKVRTSGISSSPHMYVMKLASSLIVNVDPLRLLGKYRSN